jgi:hypothetical protein
MALPNEIARDARPARIHPPNPGPWPLVLNSGVNLTPRRI